MIKEQQLNLGPEAEGADGPLLSAVRDFLEGLRSNSVWGMLAWYDIRQRYRRSVLGPFWLTISAGLMVGALGFLYSVLLNQEVKTYIPFVAVGLIVWMFISTLLNEAPAVFVSSEGMLKQIRLPLTVCVCRMVWRNLIIFAHNFIIIVIVAIWARTPINLELLLLLPAVLIICFNGLTIGIILGIFSTRFRDIAPLIASLTQVLFFVTPIMWTPQLISSRGVGIGWIVEYNPVFHFIQIIRAPILGEPIFINSWVIVIGISIFTWLLSIMALVKYRHRVAYWL